MRRSSLLGLVLLALGASPASGDQRIVAGPSIRYLTPSVTMDQGERLTFANQDAASHDVRARARRPDGESLFASPVLGPGREAFVEGSQYLTTGSYQFFCSLHPSMTGTLSVTAAGTPQPRPGSGGGGGAGGEGGAGSRPALRTRFTSSRLAAVARTGRLRFALRVDRPLRIEYVVLASAGPRRRLEVAAGSRRLAGPGRRLLSARLSREGRRLARNASSVRFSLIVLGTDEGGREVAVRQIRRIGR